MDITSAFASIGFLSSPLTFAFLIGLTTVFVVLALMPAQAARTVRDRLDEYVDKEAIVEDADGQVPFGSRAVMPLLRKMLRRFGRLAPTLNLENTRQKLVEAGDPG